MRTKTRSVEEQDYPYIRVIEDVFLKRQGRVARYFPQHDFYQIFKSRLREVGYTIRDAFLIVRAGLLRDVARFLFLVDYPSVRGSINDKRDSKGRMWVITLDSWTGSGTDQQKGDALREKVIQIARDWAKEVESRGIPNQYYCIRIQERIW